MRRCCHACSRSGGINNSQAGFVSGAFFAGYMAAVPLLTGLTDRVDARRVYLFSCQTLATALGAFALLAQGFVTAALCQAAIGAGIAGTYMPGLRVLADNTSGPAQSRAVSFYTATGAPAPRSALRACPAGRYGRRYALRHAHFLLLCASPPAFDS